MAPDAFPSETLRACRERQKLKEENDALDILEGILGEQSSGSVDLDSPGLVEKNRSEFLRHLSNCQHCHQRSIADPLWR